MDRIAVHTWVDFAASRLPRALLNVPVTRKQGVATIFTMKQNAYGAPVTESHSVPEKTLQPPQYLSLVERVELRRRAHLFSRGSRGCAITPAWDFEGPDLPYFSEYASALHSTSIKAGPWVIDGRQLVADAKDRVLQVAEAIAGRWGTDAVAHLYVMEPFARDYETKRGWKIGEGIWSAWWSGVRKAREALSAAFPSLVLHAITPSSEETPFAWQPEAARMSWARSLPEELNDAQPSIVMVGCDPFASLGSSDVEKAALAFANIPQTLTAWVAASPVYQSTWPAAHRHPLWKPDDGLARITLAQHKGGGGRPRRVGRECS